MADSNINIEITEDTPISIEIVEDTPVQLEITTSGPAGADGVVQSIVAGSNITVNSTDPANPIVSATGGGGGGMQIGDEVIDANPNRALFTDADGNLSDDVLRSKFLSFFGGVLSGEAVKPVSFQHDDSLLIGGFDATSLGGFETFAVVQSIDRSGGLGYVKVDYNNLDTVPPETIFLVGYNADTNETQILYYPNGQLTDPYPFLSIDETGITINNSQKFNEVVTELLSATDSQIPTAKAVADAIDAVVTGVDWGDIGGTLASQTDLQSALDAKENAITAGTSTQYYRGDKTFQTLDKTAVGLGNVDNTSDANKPVSTAQATADNLRVLKSGDTMTGNLTISKAQPDLVINRASDATPGLVRFETGAVPEWYFGLYSTGINNFELHRASGGASGFIMRYTDQYILVRYGMEMNYATADTIAIFNSSKQLISASTGTYPSLTELARVKGVTSNIQTQITAKVPYTGATADLDLGIYALESDTVRANSSAGIVLESNNGTDVGLLGAGNTANVAWYGNHNFSLATQDTIAAFTGSGKTLGSLALATYPSLTELSYVKGVASSIQTQLNAKGDVTSSSTNTFTNKTIDANGTGNSITNLETADFATNVIDTSALMAAESDTRLASQKAIKARTTIIQPTSGDWYSMGGLSSSTSPGLTASGKLVLHPIWLGAGTLDRIAVSTSVAAVSTYRLGLYKANPTTGLPDTQTPFLDAGTVDMNATAGVQAITISQAITDPGLYWGAVLVDAYTAQPTTHCVVYSSSSGLGINGLPQDMSSLGRYRVARVTIGTVSTGSLPTVPSGANMIWAGTAPRIAVRYV